MEWPVHAKIDGPIVMIGFGSIGRGTLPLIERHFDFDKARFVVIDPREDNTQILENHGIRHVHKAVTRDNYRALLTQLLTAGGGTGFCINLSVDTSSLDIMRLCREIGALYIDTVVEPWPGFYFDKSLGPDARTNYALRQTVRTEKEKNPGGTTAVSCCGANPGMVSWFVKQALVNLAKDIGARELQGAEADGPRRLGAAFARPRRQGHPHRRARHAAGAHAEADGRLRQHMVGGGISVGGHAAGRTRLGHPREMAAGQQRHARPRRPGDLPAAARRQYPRPFLVPDARLAVRVSRHPQRSRSRSRTT